VNDSLHPPHDPVAVAPLPVSVIAEWEPGTFLENLAPAPDGGCTRYRGDLVVADSLRGALAVVDLDAGHTATVRHDPRLEPVDPTSPLPGVNGLAVTPDGDLLLTSTARSLVLRLRGDVATGPLDVLAERLVGDDLAVTDDGRAWIATHTYHSVLRLDPDGGRCDVAVAAQGVTGPTAVAVDHDGRSLVVCTTGGMLAPPPGGVEPARLLRVEVASWSRPCAASTT
jgi:hypothetical protein